MSAVVSALLIITGLTVIPATTASALNAPALSAGQTVQNPPVAGHSLTVFPNRDFVAASGYPQGADAFVEVWRGATLIGSSPHMTPADLPNTPQFDGVLDVNHPGSPCWGPLVALDPATSVTPDIRAGDLVKVTYTYSQVVGGVTTTVTAADAVTVHDLEVSTAVTQIGPDTVRFTGRAIGVGTALADADLTASIITPGDLFDINNKRIITASGAPLARDNGTLTITAAGAFTATFTGLGQFDMERALSGASEISWANVAATAGVIAEGPGGNPAGPQAGCIPFDPAVAASVSPPLNAPIASVPAGLVTVPAVVNGVSTGTKTFTLKNIGAGSVGQLHVTALTLTGTDAAAFRVTANTCVGVTVPVAGTCTITVSLVATASATAVVKRATLNVTSDSAQGVVSARLAGLLRPAGAAPYLVTDPSALTLASQAVGVTSNAYALSLHNLGNAAITGAPSVALTGANAADFQVTVPAACTNLAGTSTAGVSTCNFTATVTPSVEGPISSTATTSSTGSPNAVTRLQSGGLVTSTVVNPPPGTVSVVTFPGRKFLNVLGLADGLYTVQIVRNGSVIGTSAHTGSLGALLEIGHPGSPCWNTITPDLRAGDRVRVTNESPTSTMPIYEATIAGSWLLGNKLGQPLSTTTSVHEISPGVFEMYGRAMDEQGKPLPIGLLAAQITASTANPFDLNGRRRIATGTEGTLTYLPTNPTTNPDGTYWVARFAGINAADLARAHAGIQGATVTDGSVVTITEFGAVQEACSPVAPDVAVPPLMAKQGKTLVSPASAVLATRTIAGTTSTTGVTITNTGDAPLNITAFTPTGANAADFGVANGSTCLGQPIAIAASCTLTVSFRPAAGTAGLRTASLSIVDDVSGLVRIPVSGRAVATPTPFASVNRQAQSFGNAVVGSVAQTGIPPVNDVRTITITNTGEAPLTVSAIGTTGPAAADFVDNSVACVRTYAVGDSCDLTILFKPTALGVRNAALTITSDDPDSPVSVPLSGSAAGITDAAGNVVNDPPAAGHQIIGFTVRDYVVGLGFGAGSVVDVEAYRPNKTGGLDLIGQAQNIIPVDLPATPQFDGQVEVNHVGTAGWGALPGATAGVTPDLRPGDVIRTIETDAAGTAVWSRDQTYLEDVMVDQGVAIAGANSVVVTGSARNVRTGGTINENQLEVRIIAKNGTFANGKRVLRAIGGAAAAGDGVLAMDPADPTRWTATFAGLSAADVALTREAGSAPTVLWLGRSPAALSESTQYEWDELPGAQAPAFPPAIGGELQFSTLATAAPANTILGVPTRNTPLNVGLSGVGAAAAANGNTVTFTVSNVLNRDTKLTGMSIAGLNPADFAVVPGNAAGECAVGTVLAPGATCAATVRITATKLGLRQASLKVDHVDPATGLPSLNSPEFLPIEGTGVGAPTITSFTPTSAGAGTRITLTGTGFSGATSVTVPSPAGSPVTKVAVTVVSDTSATFTVPAFTAAQIGTGLTGPLSITNPAGTGTSTASFTIAPNPPVVTALAPLTTPVIAGTQVRIVGQRLNTVTAVTIGGLAAQILAGSIAADGTSLVATVPVGAPATSTVAVVAPTGTTTATATLTVQQPPVITSSALVKTVVTFTGTGFNASTTLKILGVNAVISARTATTLTATVPTTAVFTATVVPLVEVTNTVTTQTTSAPLVTATATMSSTYTGFVPLTAPIVTGLTSPDGPTGCVSPSCQTAIGRTVTINGNGFYGVSGVVVGGTKALAFTVNSPTSITATVPAKTPAGQQAVAVTTAGGTSAANALRITVVAPPTISGFTPAISTATARVITVSGTDLGVVRSVKVGTLTLVPGNGTTIGTFTIVNPTLATAQIRFTASPTWIPAGSTFVAVSITATNIAGSATSVQALRINA